MTSAVAILCGAAAATGGPANAGDRATDPIIASGALLTDPRSADGSRIDTMTIDDSRSLTLQVYSAAMDKNVEIKVQRPADTSVARPALYLLAGAGGGADSATWEKQTSVLKFLAGKNVNVIQPVGGAWSYYTDWRAPDPVLGVNKWKTFFTEELPPLVDAALGTDSRNAIAGLSMAGTAVLELPIAKPGLFRAAAAYSGCAQISDPIGYQFARTVVAVGGGDTDNMYGPFGDPMWAANDPYVHADQLRGMDLYISNGTGLPGKYDTLNGPRAIPGIAGLANQTTVGGVLEAAADYCSRNLQQRLDALGIPATYDFAPLGTHSWGYWQDALVASWPVLARGLGLPA